MAKFRVYGNRTAEETVLEKNNRTLARIAAQESIVLLKNDNVLPLVNKNIALYGAGARLTIKGGSGSGDVHERYSVNIEQGLLNCGFQIRNTLWLDRFTKQYEKEKEEFVAKIEDAIKGYSLFNVMKMFIKIGEFKLAYPVGDTIKADDLTDEADTAIYVIARQAGEGDDRKLEKGDYLLSDLEVRNIKGCTEHYKNVVVIVNCGSILDLSPLDGLNVKAILFYGQAGEEGGSALAEVLSGKATPSGKLTDTWGKNYSDYPLSLTSEYPIPDKLDENYYEGIYVGYRYFDAQNITPRYPFGFGLSYTEFTREVKSVAVNGSQVTLTVGVKNIGKEYGGKEVVQIYLAKPNTKYDGEIKSLVAFAKTKLLAPSEAQDLTITFDIRDSAAYDESKAAYVLESGLYGIYVGNSSADNTVCAALRIKEDTVTEQCKNLCKKQKDFPDFTYKTATVTYSEDLPIYDVESINIEQHVYKIELPEHSQKVDKYLKKLSDKQLLLFCMGGGYFTKMYNRVAGACGNTTSKLVKKGIPNIIMSDGPAGINLLQKQAFTKGNGYTKYIDELPKEWQWGWLRKWIPRLKFLFAKPKHIHCYQYCTAWPIATNLAQTWNTELVQRVGNGVGKEMVTMGVTLWLAPALNIHRDPLCGRNFEYYSEDPLVSGVMAAAMTRGVQTNKGVGVTIKHFACNNRENDRMQVSSNLSERALREIYLKGFRIAVREKPKALMSSYNRINGVYAPNNRELLTDILCAEWGYQGLTMSDWNAVEQCSDWEAIKAGNHIIMPGDKKMMKRLKKSLKDGKLKREDLLQSATRVMNIIFDSPTSKGF